MPIVCGQTTCLISVNNRWHGDAVNYYMTTIESHTNSAISKELAKEWHRFTENGSGDVVFSSLDWFQEWQRTFKSQTDEERLLVVRKNGLIRGICPCVKTAERWGPLNAQSITAAGWNSMDYTSFYLGDDIAGDMPQVIEHILGWEDWDVISLKRVPSSSVLNQAIDDIAAQAGLEIVREPGLVCPYLPLKGSFDDYAGKQFTSKFRNRIRGKRKKLANLGTHRFEFYSGPKYPLNLDSILQRLVELESRSFKGLAGIGIFNTERKTRFYQNIAKQLAKRNRFALHLQWLDDRLISYHYGFVTPHRYYDYNMAYDPEFAKFSPGLLALSDLVRRCYELGLTVFDFLRGDEFYKSQWTDTATQNVHIHLFLKTLKTSAMRAGLRARLKARLVKRQFRPISDSGTFKITDGYRL